ncbi:MAG: GNAT family N-acetyltransferase [Anaerolineales bacterium]
MTELILLNDTVNIMDAPLGFVFRRYRGESDLPLMVELINIIARADQHDFVQTLDDLRNQYTHLMNCDMERDFVMVETGDGQTVAYARLWWEIDDEGLLRFPIVLNLHPDFRQPPDVGLAVLRWAEARACEIGATHPHTGPRVLQAWVANIELERDRIAALEAANYTAVRWGYLMTRDLAEPIEDRALPEGLEVRPVTVEHYRAIWDAHIEAFRDHWGFREPTATDYEMWLNEPDRDHSLWQVAWSGDEVAGMVLTFIPTKENETLGLKRGWTDPISVRRPWRKIGLAKALILRSLRLLKEQGMTEAALGVDSQNPNGALQLYESCGFKPVKRGTTYRKNL